MNQKDRLAEIDAKIVKLSIVSLPGPILTAFGLLGKYGEPDEIPFEFLDNALVTSAMLAVGGLILFVTFVFIIKLGIAKTNAQDNDRQ